jgi:hypothetical protein
MKQECQQLSVNVEVLSVVLYIPVSQRNMQKMEAACFSVMVVYTYEMRRYSYPEDHRLKSFHNVYQPLFHLVILSGLLTLFHYSIKLVRTSKNNG